MLNKRQEDDVFLRQLSATEKTALYDFVRRSSRPHGSGDSLEEHLLVSLALALRGTERMT